MNKCVTIIELVKVKKAAFMNLDMFKCSPMCDVCSPEPKANTGDVSSSIGASQGSSGGMAPSLGGLFAAGFPTLRPIGQRDLVGKTTGWLRKLYFYLDFCIFTILWLF